MGQFFCSGAASIYVGVGPGRAPLFLGHHEGTPELDHTVTWDGVMADPFGSKDVADLSYQGEGELFLPLVLTRFNYPVLQLIKSLPSPFFPGAAPGITALSAMGSLMATEGLLYPVTIAYQFGVAGAAKAAYATMPPGVVILNAHLWPPRKTSMGTRPLKEQLVFHGIKTFNVASQSFALYSENPALFRGLPPIN